MLPYQQIGAILRVTDSSQGKGAFMKKHIDRLLALLVILALSLFLASCGLFKTTIRPPEAPYIKGGLNFHLRGDNRLNVYQQVPHALLVCAYQLKDANAFHQILEDKDGWSRLLECHRFDGSVNYAKRLIVQPGQDIFEAMEKTEGTTMLGIVAGYYNFDRKKAVKLFSLPMSGMPMFRKPGGMDVSLRLTDQEICTMAEDEP